MDLLNLTLGQFLALAVPLSGALVALYFYDRSRRRLIVSTLRFWPRRPAPPKTRRHRKLQQPLSLLLQVLAMLLLLLAAADFRFGSFGGPQRHHVLILETSAWMNAPGPGGGGSLMEEARGRAEAYLRAIPSNEPVMLIRADGLPAPATAFTANRGELREAIRQSQPGHTAANLGGALDLARSALDLTTAGDRSADLLERVAEGSVGEIAFVGSARVLRGELAQIRTSGIPALRLITVGEQMQDAGIRQFTAQRSPQERERWRVVALVANHSPAAKNLRLNVTFNGNALGHRDVRVPAENEQAVEFTVRTQNPGTLEATLGPEDVFLADNTATVELPAYRQRTIEVYSGRASRWRPLVGSIQNVDARLRPTSEYSSSEGSSGSQEAGAPAVQVFHRFAPSGVAGGAVFVDPPGDDASIPVAREVSNVRITRWGSPHVLAEGLNDADFRLPRTAVFETTADDTVVAECAAGPVIVLRERNGRREILVGFDLLDEQLQGRLSTPLLFANIVRYFAPDVFRGTAVRAAAPGLLEWQAPPVDEEQIEVFSSQQERIPWRLIDGRVRLYAGKPGVVTIRTPEQESRLNLTLPEVGDARWNPPDGVLRGVPPPAGGIGLAGVPLWPWLSLLALAILAVDWRYYGRGSSAAAASVGTGSESSPPETVGLGLGRPENVREEQLTR